jgi:hypothetical protein
MSRFISEIQLPLATHLLASFSLQFCHPAPRQVASQISLLEIFVIHREPKFPFLSTSHLKNVILPKGHRFGTV